MGGPRVVDTSCDAALLEMPRQCISRVELHDVEVPHVLDVDRGRGKRDVTIREQVRVQHGMSAAEIVPPIEMAKLHAQNRSLQGVQAVVETDTLVLVLPPLSVVPEHLRPLRDV